MNTTNTEKVYFGAGCFWGVEAAFRQTEGIKSTKVGYMGGDKANPTYEDVCSGTTGHAEVVEVEFNPSTFPFEKVLTIFWQNHNPTTKNRQGPDVGAQYRSVIFYTTEDQRTKAEQTKTELNKSETWAQPVVTTIDPAGPFWEAEEYHQRYLEKRGLASCHI